MNVPPSPTGVYLARHGQTAYNFDGRFQGRLPVPLDETGFAQAAALAEQVAGMGLAALWASTLTRACQTAGVVAQRIGLQPRPQERLVETDAGDWTDRTFAEIEQEQPQALAAFRSGEVDFGFPGGESFAQQAVRVDAALSEIERGPLPALVVCHGVVIRVALTARRPEGWVGHLHGPVANGALVPLPLDARRAAA
jgi:probable phosphoglycerate mutase